MNCEKCGEVCGCPAEPPPFAKPAAEISPVEQGIEAAENSDDETPTGSTAWRGELSARLSRYRARRKAPPPRYPSLKLPFEAADSSARASITSRSGTFEAVSSHALALDGTRAPLPEESEIDSKEAPNVKAPSPAIHSGAKIIEFPRLAWAPPPPPSEQLAGPVFERPRILDVPETTPAPPALGGITIDPPEERDEEKRPGIDSPLRSAPLMLRLAAVLVDTLIIAAAAALFGFIFWKVAAVRPPRLQMAIVTAGILFIFWAAYQYLLIVYSGGTPGLRAAGLSLSRFDGSGTSRSLRRWRVLASYLSALSLGMGYAWVFLDEDALCWHDRITHTYLAPGDRSAARR